MQKRWVLSKFYTDAEHNMLFPVANAYGGDWHCPAYPSVSNGWALVEIVTLPHQIEAAKQDPRIVVCPNLFDPSPVPVEVVNTYSSMGVTSGMSMGSVLTALANAEPLFGQEWNP